MKIAHLSALVLLVGPPVAQSAGFVPLGELAAISGMSGDGQVLVGARVVGSTQEAFRWSLNGGYQSLGGSSSAVAWASDLSFDGSIVVGTQGDQAFRWSESTGLVALGYPGAGFDCGGPGPPCNSSSADAISGDGSVIAGTAAAYVPQGAPYWNVYLHAWSAEAGWAQLSDTAGHPRIEDTSFDGSVIVGKVGATAFRWTAATGFVSLGVLPDIPGEPPPFSADSSAMAVTPDGGTAIGWSSSPAATGACGLGTEGFRWTAAGGMQPLGMLAGDDQSVANAISADGAVIVGSSSVDVSPSTFCTFESDSRAVVWVGNQGPRDLLELLVAEGVTGLDGWALRSAEAVSGDGTWIAGYGINPLGQGESFLVNVALVPLPPVAFLFGSALAVLGWVRRNRA